MVWRGSAGMCHADQLVIGAHHFAQLLMDRLLHNHYLQRMCKGFWILSLIGAQEHLTVGFPLVHNALLHSHVLHNNTSEFEMRDLHAVCFFSISNLSQQGTGKIRQSRSCAVGSDHHLAVLLEHVLEVVLNRLHHAVLTSI